MRCEPILCRGDDPLLLPQRYRLSSLVVSRSGLDLDEQKDLSSARDDIELADWCSEAAGSDAKSLCNQQQGRPVFS
jgi:hypothetical protein